MFYKFLTNTVVEVWYETYRPLFFMSILGLGRELLRRQTNPFVSYNLTRWYLRLTSSLFPFWFYQIPTPSFLGIHYRLNPKLFILFTLLSLFILSWKVYLLIFLIVLELCLRVRYWILTKDSLHYNTLRKTYIIRIKSLLLPLLVFQVYWPSSVQCINLSSSWS